MSFAANRSRRFPSRLRRRGFALLLALMAVTLTAVLAFTAMSLVTFETQGGLQEALAARTYYMARRGIAYASSKLGTNNGYTGETVTFGEGSCTVTVTPDAANSGSSMKRWAAISVGTIGTASRTLKAWLVSESFSRYVYFSNIEPTGGVWTTGNVFEGPVHTNGHFTLYGVPQYQSRVTSANSDQQATPARSTKPYDPSTGTYYFNYSSPRAGTGTSTDPAKFYASHTGNWTNDRPTAYNNSQDFTFAGGQPTIPMPTSMAGVANGATNTFNGDVTILFNANGTATVTPASGSAVTVNTYPTATIYVNGGNARVSGTVHGKVTVGAMATSTSDTTKGNINVTGSLLYSDTASTPHNDVTGLVAWNNVNIVTSTTVRQDVSIFASVMAIKGSYQVTNYNSGIWRGQLILTGGLINANAGFTGCISSAGAFTSGYQESYHYDARLLDSPPPNFPTTGNVILRGLQDYGALGI